MNADHGRDAPHEEPTESSDPQPALASHESALLGHVNISGCPSERTFIEHAVEAARYVAVSEAFFDCLDTTMRTATALVRQGSPVTLGPYKRHPDDPGTSTQSISTTVNAVFYMATNTNDLVINCSIDESYLGLSNIGDYDTAEQSNDGFSVGVPFQELEEENSQPYFVDTPAALFHAPRAKAAAVIWHEGAHQWGYRHPETFAQSLGAVPYIVGACMETTMHRSRDCPNTCGDNRVGVKRWGGTACDCIDDPVTDVGVILEDGASCPTPPGRHEARSLSFTMDNEDSANNSQTTGWSGKCDTTSNKNTVLRFCGVPGTRFRSPPLSIEVFSQQYDDYAVLKMGISCPVAASHWAYAHLENEANANDNSSSGHIDPNESTSFNFAGSSTGLHFCIFGETVGASGTPTPSLGMSYGVLARPTFPWAKETGSMFVDTEDDGDSSYLWQDNLGLTTSITGAPISQTSDGIWFKLARVR